MQPTLIFLGTLFIGLALRSCKTRLLKKLGALTYLVATALAIFVCTGCAKWSLLGVVALFCFPWFDLMLRVRKLRLPLKKKLNHCYAADESLFPNADSTIDSLEDAGFEYVESASWKWANSTQCYQFFWHPEERAVATVCFCKQKKITFSFLTIYSRDDKGSLWRTTNYPFSKTLQEAETVAQNRLSYKNTCIQAILASHHRFISLYGAEYDDLIIPDPEKVADQIEQDMSLQIQYNLKAGLIILADDDHFRYTYRGLFFLWKQFILDIIRLC